jgi:lysophospholipase L1-like esterase
LHNLHKIIYRLGILDVEIKLLDLGETPTIVTLFTGANDIIAGASPARFELDLAAILNHLRKIDGLEIYIADLPDITQLPRFKDNPDSDVTSARVTEFNRIIYKQAQVVNAQVVALSIDAPNDALISDDGLHPNNDGYARMAELFLQEILPR